MFIFLPQSNQYINAHMIVHAENDGTNIKICSMGVHAPLMIAIDSDDGRALLDALDEHATKPAEEPTEKPNAWS